MYKCSIEWVSEWVSVCLNLCMSACKKDHLNMVHLNRLTKDDKKKHEAISMLNKIRDNIHNFYKRFCYFWCIFFYDSLSLFVFYPLSLFLSNVTTSIQSNHVCCFIFIMFCYGPNHFNLLHHFKLLFTEQTLNFFNAN